MKVKDFIDLSVLKDAQPGFSSQSVLLAALATVNICLQMFMYIQMFNG